MWSRLRLRKLIVALLATAFVFVTIRLSILRRRDGGAAVSEPNGASTFPPRFTDYAAYRNLSDELRRRIPGPMDDYGDIDAVIDELDLCERRRPEVRIVCCVHSAPWHGAQRNLIRQTWGSDRLYDRLRMVTVFFVGRTSAAGLQQSILNESATHHDVVQMDFEDHYYNLTYKAVTALDWVRRRCAGADFVLKTDDDVFVDVFQFVRTLRDLSASKDDVHNLVYCYVHAKMGPHRNPKSKWYVDTEEYPWNNYPDFCAGMAVYFRTSVVHKLLNATRHVPYLKLDDVYVTGLLRDKAGVKLKDVSKTISLFDGHFCAKPNTAEVFCHIPETKRKWDIWMDLLLAETARLSKHSKSRQKSYIKSLYDLIKDDLEGIE